ncbi:disease resistance protein RPM1-like [Prunus yedoensis var. nudiflora]|uniref:Disease resistance protein RPM1-like n=1 Tax=Prunus yedoensis var. nudiflora TaxID=2094558 RepID=A0A314XZK8_PRUYE|nr:disease resistance protein RPM1-like [Prunus yedoensis var. nudiflora]
MTAFLRIADAFEESDEEVKVWVKQVRDIAHDIEDVLDEFTILQAHDHGMEEQGLLYGSIRRLSCCIKNTKARYRITSQLQGINLRIRKISDVRKRLSHKFCTSEVAGKRWATHGGGGDALLLGEK